MTGEGTSLPIHSGPSRLVSALFLSVLCVGFTKRSSLWMLIVMFLSMLAFDNMMVEIRDFSQF